MFVIRKEELTVRSLREQSLHLFPVSLFRCLLLPHFSQRSRPILPSVLQALMEMILLGRGEHRSATEDGNITDREDSDGGDRAAVLDGQIGSPGGKKAASGEEDWCPVQNAGVMGR